jgi:hypothetical protein
MVKIVMTLMVRDEADIIVAMIEHHLDQGVDLIIATDNGSVDATPELLAKYAEKGVVELHHERLQQMQQGTLVTGMARRACTEHGADWVINADADEFLVPLDRSLTIRQALERTPVALRAFTVPVVNLVGAAAERGAGVDRLTWRDHRTDEQLVSIGIHAQPTPNSIHVGDPGVSVSEGNHFVSLESRGQPEPAVSMEVLHLPWRSWTQFERKVLNAGAAFEASPNLRPSPKHHGMADYRRALAGRLSEAFHLRLPLDDDLESQDVFVEDAWLAQHLHDLVPRAIFPDLLEDALDGSTDGPYSAGERAQSARNGARFLELELERDEQAAEVDELSAALRRHHAAHRSLNEELRATIARERAEKNFQVAEKNSQIVELQAALAETEERVRRLRRQRNKARQEVARLTAWVPVRTDVVRLGQRLAQAMRRRVTR